MSLSKFKYEVGPVAFYFPKTTFGGMPKRPCRLTDDEADLLVAAAEQYVAPKENGKQAFSYRDHLVEMHVVNSGWVDFGIFQCEQHGTFTTDFTHSRCRA